MSEKTRITGLLRAIDDAVAAVSGQELRDACAEILRAERVFLCGAGQTGLVLRMFGMRLMQLGLRVHFAGDSLTPAAGKGDLLLAASGSGNTGSVLVAVEQARAAGAGVLAIVGAPGGALAKAGVRAILVPVPCRQDFSAPRFVGQFLNSLFEHSLLFMTCLLTEDIMRACDECEEQMQQRHANLE